MEQGFAVSVIRGSVLLPALIDLLRELVNELEKPDKLRRIETAFGLVPVNELSAAELQGQLENFVPG